VVIDESHISKFCFSDQVGAVFDLLLVDLGLGFRFRSRV